VWLIDGMALTGHGLYVRRLPGVGASTIWTVSPRAAFDHLLAPVLSSGVLAPAAVWALAAAVLPLIRLVRRAPGMNLVLVLGWAVGTAMASAIVLNIATRGHGVILAGEGVLGALACGFGALAPDVRGRWRGPEPPTDANAELA
jgi:hypothetical protein